MKEMLLPFQCIIWAVLSNFLLANVYAIPAPAAVGTCPPAAIFPTSREPPGSQIPLSTGDNGNDDQAPSIPIKKLKNRSELNARATNGAIWNQAIFSGRRLWSQLNGILTNPDAQDAPVCDIEKHWTAYADLNMPMKLSDDWNEIKPPALDPQRDEAFYEAMILSPGLPVFKYQYNNMYSPTLKAIVAVNNFGAVTLDHTPIKAPDHCE